MRTAHRSGIIVAAGFVLALLSFGGVAQASPNAAQVRSFEQYTATLKADLHSCTKAVYGAEVSIASGLKKKTVSKLAAASKKAEKACAESTDPSVARLSKVTVPATLSSIQSLRTVSLGAQVWANTNTTKVLGDLQQIIGQHTTTTATSAQLKTDITSADSTLSSIDSSLKQAAKSLGVQHFAGIGLLNWT